MTATRKEAKELVLRHIPEILVNLVGQQAARNGAGKVFETLQDQVPFSLTELYMWQGIMEIWHAGYIQAIPEMPGVSSNAFAFPENELFDNVQTPERAESEVKTTFKLK